MVQSQQLSANRLINQASPYLLQHAKNPVDWYPWCDEAFEEAKKQDKPIFLSIGYSTCHWCHVMAHESFEDARIAGIMNENFINIKVDREERPDLDELYMTAVQAMSGTGGWPLSVFLTPQGKPFYGGTYFPVKDSFGRPSFERVLLAVIDSWKTNRRELIDSASSVVKVIIQPTAVEQAEVPGQVMLDEAFLHLEDSFDWEYGGFGVAPKFPSPSYLNFLLSYWWRTRNDKALQMAIKTINAIAAGGIRDHIGGGFHRYSTDRHWIYPHFEKMLYDQAQLADVCLYLFQVTRDDKYARLARHTLDYVLRDMSSPAGGFFSAEDADSEGREGAFYTWNYEEIQNILGKDAEIFSEYYNITSDGNFEGKNILHVTMTKHDFAQKLEKDVQSLDEILLRCREKLLLYRSKRERPGLDDKIITGWNALMISAFANAYAILGEIKYLEAALKSADFVFTNLMVDGKLKRYYKDSKRVENGFLEDYAFMSLACIDLYQATFKPEWLKQAGQLVTNMCELFEDTANGGFLIAPRERAQLIVPIRPVYDSSVPSGNSAAVTAILKLGKFTMNPDLVAKAERAFAAFSKFMVEAPTSVTQMLTALGLAIGPTQEIVIAPGQNGPRSMLAELHKEFLPNALYVLHDNQQIENMIPFVSQQNPIENKTTAYICQNFTCKSPINDEKEFKHVLERLSPAVHG
jgi:uncharacterized protein YyaL (SSP411 family)